MSTRLTRQSFANSLACPRLGWFSRLLAPPAALSPDQGTLAERYSTEEQREVHARARARFPDAATVTRQAYEAACWQTQDLLERTSTRALLEAAFGTTTCRARADALVREGDAWRLYEVRPERHLTSGILNDAAFIQMVLHAAGLRLSGATVLLVSGDFRTGMPDRDLFQALDVSEGVASRAARFAQDLPVIEAQTRSSEPPPPRLVPHCRRCPLFTSCAGADLEHPIFELPHLSPKQLSAMLARGWSSVGDVPEEAPLRQRQKTVWRSIREGKAVAGDGLRGELEAIQWPVHYLDLETVGTVLPLFPDVAPLEQLPFLYSVRLCDAPGRLVAHRAFLSPHDRESSRELAERLLLDLDSDGSVLVYSQYQTRVLRGLARRHPDLAQPLARVGGRLVDLEAIVRRNLYHPGFHGKLTMRAVLATLVPGLSYIDLEIEDARTASASFAFLSRGGYYSATRAPLIRRDLYSYCARDTLGLMRLHEAVLRLSAE